MPKSYFLVILHCLIFYRIDTSIGKSCTFFDWFLRSRRFFWLANVDTNSSRRGGGKTELWDDQFLQVSLKLRPFESGFGLWDRFWPLLKCETFFFFIDKNLVCAKNDHGMSHSVGKPKIQDDKVTRRPRLGRPSYVN